MLLTQSVCTPAVLLAGRKTLPGDSCGTWPQLSKAFCVSINAVSAIKVMYKRASLMIWRAAQDETVADTAHLLPAGHEEPIPDAQAAEPDASTAATNAAASEGELFSMSLHRRFDPLHLKACCAPLLHAFPLLLCPCNCSKTCMSLKNLLFQAKQQSLSLPCSLCI